MPYTMQQRHIRYIITTILLGFVSVTAVSCGDDEAQRESCSTTQSECSPDGTGYRICVSGYWSVAIPCLENQTCKNGQCYDVLQRESCTATQPVCLPDGTGYRVCVSGYWSDVIPCSGAQTCKNGQCSGEDITSKLPCKAGDESRCVSGSRIQFCGADNFWTFIDCPTDIPVCHNGECKSLECTPGNKRCVSDKQSQKCNGNGFWEDDNFCSATNFCFNGDCVEKCSPGEKKCVTDSMLYICGTNGYWEAMPCTGGKFCINSSCQEKGCEENETRCASPFVKEFCSNGKWNVISCENICAETSDGKHQCLSVDATYNHIAPSRSVCIAGNYLKYYYLDSYYHDLPCVTCVSAQDNVGATCSEFYNPLHQNSDKEKAAWDEYSICSKVDERRYGQYFGYDSFNNVYFGANSCQYCKMMEDGSKRWVVVADDYCD